MDLFDAAARRLEKDQSNIRGRARGQGAVVSEKAKKEAEFRKKQQERLRRERDEKQRHLLHIQQYFTACERGLGVRSLADGGLKLQATSIHGDGDKIALPPSVLQRLTDGGASDIMDGSSPWTFRVGLLNPKYLFPSSSALIQMKLPEDQDDAMEQSDDDEEETSKAAYLEELQYKYLSYSHGTVVEFTQEEGFIGLPVSIASALLDIASDVVVPITRTKDPAGGEDSTMDDVEDERTPGHLFWGGFDLPDMLLEVSLVKLPKGRECTLVPTKEAILNGFYDLKDIKLVLEQSLIRTRATLSLRDTVHTWRRGVKYDLTVTKLTPSYYGAVSCINTDIEVDLGANEEVENEIEAKQRESAASSRSSSPKREDQGSMLGTGRTLSNSAILNPSPKTEIVQSDLLLLPEPPLDQTEGVCTVQIKADGKTGRRRLNVKVASVGDLFDFAASIIQLDPKCFRLVTRFPRRVLTLSDKSLEEAGIAPGQELFLVETI